jgi:hypothetical protein
MRATFCDMHLFNDASRKHDTYFILNRKEWGVSKAERERKRENEKRVKDRVWVRKSCGVGHKLGRWPSIYEGLVKG